MQKQQFDPHGYGQSAYQLIDGYIINTKKVLGDDFKGTCFECMHESSKVQVCAKKIRLNGRMIQNSLNLEPILRVKHENLVQIYKVSIMDDFCYIFMEKCVQSLESKFNTLLYEKADPEYIIKIIQQVIRGFKILSEKNIVHHNLKSTKILIGQDGFIKISGYGLDQIPQDQMKKHRMYSPQYFQSPQTILKGTLNEKSDVFSLGVIIYSLMFTRHPYMNDLLIDQWQTTYLQLLKNQKTSPLGLSEIEESKNPAENKLWKFLKQSLSLAESSRPSWNEFQYLGLEIQIDYDDCPTIDKRLQSSQGFQQQIYTEEAFNSFTTPKVGKQIMAGASSAQSRNFHPYRQKQNNLEKPLLKNELIETMKGQRQFDEQKLIKLFDVLLAKVNFAEMISASLIGKIEKHKWYSLIVLDYYLIAYKLTLLNICFELSQGREPDQFLKIINYFPPHAEIMQSKQMLQSQITGMQETVHREFKYANRFMERIHKVEPVRFNYLYFQDKASIIIKDWLQMEIKSINESKQFLFACTLYKFSQFEQIVPMNKFEEISISTIGYVDESDESLQCYKNEIAVTK